MNDARKAEKIVYDVINELIATKIMGIDIEKLAKKRFKEYVEANRGKGMIGNERWPQDCLPSKQAHFRQVTEYTSDATECLELMDIVSRKLGQQYGEYSTQITMSVSYGTYCTEIRCTGDQRSLYIVCRCSNGFELSACIACLLAMDVMTISEVELLSNGVIKSMLLSVKESVG